MIAPLRDGDETSVATSNRLRQARRTIAAALLPAADPRHPSAPPLAAWKAWLWALWAVLVVVAYLVLLLRAYA